MLWCGGLLREMERGRWLIARIGLNGDLRRYPSSLRHDAESLALYDGLLDVLHHMLADDAELPIVISDGLVLVPRERNEEAHFSHSHSQTMCMNEL